MKIIVLLALTLAFTSCAPRKKVIVENPFDNSANDGRLTNLEQRVALLESSAASNITAISGISSQLALIEADVAQQGAASDAQADAIDNLTGLLETLQESVTNTIEELATLQGFVSSQDNVVDYLNPCGDNGGYDEILLKTSSGKVIAYFENGNKRRLSFLESHVPYQTTDDVTCHFQISDDGELL